MQKKTGVAVSGTYRPGSPRIPRDRWLQDMTLLRVFGKIRRPHQAHDKPSALDNSINSILLYFKTNLEELRLLYNRTIKRLWRRSGRKTLCLYARSQSYRLLIYVYQAIEGLLAGLLSGPA